MATADQTTKANEPVGVCPDEAREVRRALAEIQRIVSHDLREPVRSIRGFIGLIKDELPNDDPGTKGDRELRELLRFVEEAAERMAALVQDLNDRARPYRVCSR